MDLPPIGELELAAKKLVWTAQKQGNIRDFTPRLIRQAIEKQFNLEEGTLDASEFKSTIKAATQYAIDNEPSDDEVEDKPKANPPPKSKQKLDGNIKIEAKDKSPPKPKSTPKAKGKAKAKAIASEDEDIDAPTPKKKRKVMSKAKNVASDEEEDYKDEDTSRNPKKKPKTDKPKTKKVVSENEDEHKGTSRSSSKPRTKQGKDSKVYKSAEHVPTSDTEQDEPNTVEARKPNEINKQPTSLAPPKRDNAQPESSKSVAIEMEDTTPKSESELSVLIDEPPKRKRKKSNSGEKASKGSEKSKPKKAAKSSVALSKDEETIKRLKSLVVACGMRKVWSKVLQGLDTPQQQIKKLREILTDLGMTGRMSIEQAKAIKEKRELEKELADVQEFAEKMEGRTSRSRGNATTKSSVGVEESEKEEDKSSEDEEVEAPKKRPVCVSRALSSRKSIMAFLGDQSDEE